MSGDYDWMNPLLEAATERGVTTGKSQEPPVDAWWEANGLKFHGLDWGHEGNTPMICLHGGGQQAHTWDFVSLAFRDDFHVRAIELRGHGDSDWPTDKDYRISSLASDVHGIATEQLELEPFVLVGLSMGGMTTLNYASRWPETLKAIVVVDVAIELESDGVNNLMQFMSGPESFDDFEALVDRVLEFNPRRPRHHLQASLKHNLRQQEDGSWTWKYDNIFRTGELSRDAIWHREEMIEQAKNIPVPMLLVRGADSDIMSTEGAQYLVDLVPNGEMAVVPDAGHSVMGDNPPAFEKTIRDWLKSKGIS